MRLFGDRVVSHFALGIKPPTLFVAAEKFFLAPPLLVSKYSCQKEIGYLTVDVVHVRRLDIWHRLS